MKEITKYNDFEFMWTNHGKDLHDHQWKLEDALNLSMAPEFVPKVINEAVIGPIEPNLVITGLMYHMPYESGQHITMPVMGSLQGEWDVGPQEEFREVNLFTAGGVAISSVGKTGASIKFDEETMRYGKAGFGIVEHYTTEVVKALRRYKEQKAVRMLMNTGFVAYDNMIPSASQWGNTHGRGFTGAGNGSFIMEDLLHASISIMENGFNPNLLIMHPLCWLIFIQDPNFRQFALNSGGGVFFQRWNGNAVAQDPVATALGGKGISAGRSVRPMAAPNGTASDPKATAINRTATPIIPSYFGGGPIDIIVSPFMPYDETRNVTSIVLADREQLGYFFLDQELGAIRIEEPLRDMFKIRLKERYSFGIKNEGFGISHIRNIKVEPNQIVLPAQATIPVNGTLSEISTSVPVVT